MSHAQYKYSTWFGALDQIVLWGQYYYLLHVTDDKIKAHNLDQGHRVRIWIQTYPLIPVQTYPLLNIISVIDRISTF